MGGGFINARPSGSSAPITVGCAYPGLVPQSDLCIYGTLAVRRGWFAVEFQSPGTVGLTHVSFEFPRDEVPAPRPRPAAPTGTVGSAGVGAVAAWEPTNGDRSQSGEATEAAEEDCVLKVAIGQHSHVGAGGGSTPLPVAAWPVCGSVDWRDAADPGHAGAQERGPEGSRASPHHAAAAAAAADADATAAATVTVTVPLTAGVTVNKNERYYMAFWFDRAASREGGAHLPSAVPAGGEGPASEDDSEGDEEPALHTVDHKVGYVLSSQNPPRWSGRVPRARMH